jgi:hypothetical protein
LGVQRARHKPYARVNVSDARSDHSHFVLQEGQPSYFSCARGRKTKLRIITGSKATAIISKMTLRDVYWRRVAHLLARDDTGIYYYVDRVRLPNETRFTGLDRLRGFQLWRGRRGRMKRLVLKDVVVDEAGQIFLSKGGSLHGSGRGRQLKLVFWKKGKTKTPLTIVPFKGSTFKLIYRQLGPYLGKKLRRPCDHF